MKSIYKLIFVGLTFAFCGGIYAQSINTKHNNLTAATSPDGVLFQQTETNTAGLIHNTENAGLIFSAGLWLTAIKSNGQIAASIATFKSDFSPGTTNWDDRDSLTTMVTITSEIINNHKEDYNNVGYIAPEIIRNWPTHITNNNGTTTFAAPFIDLNNNSLYEPSLGEYPDIIGNTFTFLILNDTRGARNGSNGEPIGVDVYVSIFSWNAPNDNAVNNTIYSNFKIINSSTNSYESINKGLFLDFDLGNSSDDKIGSDSTNNFIYTYNGDNDDDATGGSSLGFGQNPPAFGAQVICGNLSSSMTHASGFGPTGYPTTPNHYRNYLNSTWLDGSPLIASSYGYQTSGPSTDFLYSGDPVTGTGWVDEFIGGKLMVLSTSENTAFEPGYEQNFTIAFSYARDKTKNNIENITTLRNNFESIEKFLTSEKSSMSNYWSDNFNCLLVGVNENDDARINIHPNPTTNILNIEYASDYESYRILAVDGKVIESGNIKSTIDVRNLEAGMYQLHITKRNGNFVSTKFLKN